MKNIILVPVLVSFLFACPATAQTPKDLVPATPEAAALSKMVNYPVNLNTGVPDISIPLFEVQSGELKLPIDISYHAGGFKINERSTSVGLGWSLTCDIQITRTVNGLDDFKPNVGYLANTDIMTYFTNFNQCPGCTFPFNTGPYQNFKAQGLAMGERDGMPDKFSYKLLNKSGSFYFVKSTNGTGYTILPVPFDNIQIRYDNGRFIIIDTDGTTYYFGTAGSLDLYNLAPQGKEISRKAYIPGDPNVTDPKISTWKCLKIENAAKTEQILFSYRAKTVTKSFLRPQSIEYYNNPSPCNLMVNPLDFFTLNNQQFFPGIDTYGELINRQDPIHPGFHYLSSPKYMINYPDRSEFNLPYVESVNGQLVTRNRFFPVESEYGPHVPAMYTEGLALATISFRGGTVQFYGTDRLEEISLIGYLSPDVKTVRFESSYTAPVYTEYAKDVNGDNFAGTLYLDALRFTTPGQTQERYLFYYNQKTCFGNHLKGSNAWGYANITTTEVPMSPTTTNVPFKAIAQRFYFNTYNYCQEFAENVIFNIGGSQNAELPDETGLKRGILERIYYPTGGFADFDFEPNLYIERASNNLGYGNIVQMGGGLRIRSISYFDGTSPKFSWQKYYRYGELEDGIGMAMHVPPRKFEANKKYYDGHNYRQNIIYIKEQNNIPCATRACMLVWTQEVKDTYMTSAALDYSYPGGAPIYYTKVTEYQSDMGGQTGKKVYTYHKFDEYETEYGNRITVISGTDIPFLYTDGLMGAAKSIEEYTYENSHFRLKHSKEFVYRKYKANEQARVVYAFTYNTYRITGGAVHLNFEPYNNTSPWAAGSINYGNMDFIVGEYGIPSGKLLPAQETEKWYNGEEVLTQTTTYNYNRLPYLNPSEIYVKNSRNDLIYTYRKYAYDYPATGVLGQMASSQVNMIAQVIEETVRNGSVGRDIEQARNNYELITAGGTSFIGIASVDKAYSGAALERETSFQYNAQGKIVQVTGRDGIPTAYIWGYNYQYPLAILKGIDYATAASGLDINRLQSTTYEVELKGIMAGLRAAYPSAMVTSYTHQSLVGPLSVTDINGRETTYTYDPFGRLITVKDHEGKVLKSYSYTVLNPDQMASAARFNVPMMATMTAYCEGPPGRVTVVNKVMPGGSYMSTSVSYANQLAEDVLYSQTGSTGPLVASDDCGLPSSFATIRLFTLVMNVIPFPSNVYLDLIQGNEVVASQKVPYSTNNPTIYRTFLVKPGQYKVSFRQSPIPGGVIMRQYVSPSAGNGYWIESDASMTVEAGVTYDISVTNTF